MAKKKTAKEEKKAVKTVPHVITQDDLDADPGLVADGFKVGDEVETIEGVESEEAATAEAAASNALKAPSKKAEAVDVILGGTHYLRTYSLKNHGEDFLDLAKQFADQSEDRSIVDSSGIEKLVVSYEAVDRASTENPKGTGALVTKNRKFTAEDGEDFKERAVRFNNEVHGAIRVA